MLDVSKTYRASIRVCTVHIRPGTAGDEESHAWHTTGRASRSQHAHDRVQHHIDEERDHGQRHDDLVEEAGLGVAMGGVDDLRRGAVSTERIGESAMKNGVSDEPGEITSI